MLLRGVVAATVWRIASLQATLVDSTSLDGVPVKGALDVLNITVNGRIHANYPWALPCFSSYEGHPSQFDAEACSVVQSNYGSLPYRSIIAGSYMNTQGLACMANPANQCELDSFNPYGSPGNTTCRQGNVPTYQLQVSSAWDVQAAFQYAKISHTRLVIKNSGHDYLTRSSATQPGQLELWTRKLNKLEFHDSFTPAGARCGTKGAKAITTGAGINCGEAYAFAETKNVTLICGYSKTVGISGGWVQGGGHSVLSPVYGLGSDRVLQFKIVTPDGQARIVNKYRNKDLFWALRGGGGGTYGVVLETTHKVEDDFPLVVANFTLPTTAKEPILGMMKLLMDDAVRWGDLGWGGQIMHNQYIYVNPKLSLQEARDSVSTVAEYIKQQNGSVEIKQLPNFHEFVHDYISKYGAHAGRTTLPSSRLISRAVMVSAEGRAKLMKVLRDYMDRGGLAFTSVDVPTAFTGHVVNETAVTAGWYKSTWHFHPVLSWAWNSTLRERQAVVKHLNTIDEELENISPDTGSYVNEASPFLKSWKKAHWGDNYETLVAVKRKYDPWRLLQCWHCVGWEQTDKNVCMTFLGNIGIE